jgi:hypothetical protein
MKILRNFTENSRGIRLDEKEWVENIPKTVQFISGNSDDLKNLRTHRFSHLKNLKTLEIEIYDAHCFRMQVEAGEPCPGDDVIMIYF